MSYFDASNPVVADWGTAQQKGMEIGRKRGELQMLAQHGPGIFRGDTASLEALAQFDPQMAFNIRDTLQQRQIAASERQRTAAEREQERQQQLEARMLTALSNAPDPQTWDAIASNFASQLPEAQNWVGTFDTKRRLAQALGGKTPQELSQFERMVLQVPEEQRQQYIDAWLDKESGLTPSTGDSEFERHLLQFPPEEQERLRIARAEEMAGLRGGQQTRISTDANGNPIIEFGQLGDAGATALDKAQGKARGETLAAITAAGQEAAQSVGYLDMAERAFDVLALQGIPIAEPINDLFQNFTDPVQQRAITFAKNFNIESALDYVQSTKGAISNAEMAMFRGAAAGFGNTAEGNLMLIRMAKAAGHRAQARSEFFTAMGADRYAEADRIWNGYIAQNPAFTFNPETLEVQVDPRGPAGILYGIAQSMNPQESPALPEDRAEQPPVSLIDLAGEIDITDRISVMTIEELDRLDPSTLSPTERRSVANRYRELRMQQTSSAPAP